MATVIGIPSIKQAKGSKGELKLIEEYFGNSRTNQDDISIAVMTARKGWEEPEQIAEFDEYVYVMRGILQIKLGVDKPFNAKTGECVLINKGEKVKFSTPFEGAKYIAICKPAYQEHLVKRNEV